MLYHVPPAGVTDDLMISSKNVLNKVLFFFTKMLVGEHFNKKKIKEKVNSFVGFHTKLCV